MTRITASSFFVLASLATGCFGGGDGIFGPSEPLVDEYTGSRRAIRGDYPVGAPVTFRASLDEGMTGTVDIQVPDGFRVVERDALTVTTVAESVGEGEVVITLDGDTLGRYDTNIAEVDRLAFRRAFDTFDREDYDEPLIFHPSATVDVVVDFYAADDTRLFGRGITTVPETTDYVVVTTSNNDRVVLNTETAGVYDIPVSVNGEELTTLTFERVETVATFELQLEENDDGSRRVRPVATDAEGRSVVVAPRWTVDGLTRESTGPIENLPLDEMAHEVTAELDGTTVSLSVPAA